MMHTTTPVDPRFWPRLMGAVCVSFFSHYVSMSNPHWYVSKSQPLIYEHILNSLLSGLMWIVFAHLWRAAHFAAALSDQLCEKNASTSQSFAGSPQRENMADHKGK